jgi:hypothetical protein
MRDPAPPGEPRQRPANAGGTIGVRWRIAAPLAAAASLAIVVMVVASLNRGGPPFRGDVAGIVGTPDAGTGGSPIVPSAVFPSEAPGGGAGAPPSTGGDPTPGKAGQPAGGGSTPATLSPTARPTPPPRATSRPGPTATPTPAPTTCVHLVPDMIGARRNDAASLWAGAGFSGEVTALPGHGNYAIGSQSPAAGIEAPCTRGVTIGPAAG